MAKRNCKAQRSKDLEVRLRKRAERASRNRSPVDRARELAEVWGEAAHDRTLARKLWSTGRDAALLLLQDGTRGDGIAQLTNMLSALRGHQLYQEYISCLRVSSALLTDEELLAVVRGSQPHTSLLRDLSDNDRQRLMHATRAGLASGSVDDALFTGMLLTIEETSEKPYTVQSSVEAQAIRYSRSHGATNVAGVSFQALYGLWSMLRNESIQEISFEDLEDLTFRRASPDGRTVTQHVQAKVRSSAWSIPDLQSTSTGGNRVFDSFAEVAIVDPAATFTFATDSTLTSGSAPDLVTAARKLSTISVNATLSESEETALTQLTSRMRSDLLSELDIRELLAKVTFDACQSTGYLRSDTVLAISEALEITGPRAGITYYAAMGLLQEAMVTRRTFSRADIRGFLEQAALRADAFVGQVGKSGRVEIVNFDRQSTSTQHMFYQGLSSNPADIARSWDVLRPDLIAQVNAGYSDRNCCIIRGASGQGKTVLMYRYAYEVRDNMLVMQVLGSLDHATASDILTAADGLSSSTILVLIDNVARANHLEWPEAMKHLIQHPRIKVLATSREDDWNLSQVYTLGGIMTEIDIMLDQRAAANIFDGLKSISDQELHADDWREPYDRAGGLLMEYIYLLTQGRRMRDILSEQIESLRRRLGHEGQLVLDALRYVATAHAYGGYLTRETLSTLLGLTSDYGLGDRLKVLEQEFWIRDADNKRYVGLHELRSLTVMDIMHERELVDNSITRLLSVVDAGELASMAESIIYRWADSEPEWMGNLISRATSGDPQLALDLVQAAYAAEERRHADQFFAAIADQSIVLGQTVLHVMESIPAPHPDVELRDLLPPLGRALAEFQRASLPKRDFESRTEVRLLAALGPDLLANWLTGEVTVAQGIPLLRIASLTAPTVARQVVGSTDIDSLGLCVRTATADVALELLDAIREADTAVAVELQARLGRKHLIGEATKPDDGCLAVFLDGPVIRGRFLALPKEDARERAVLVTRQLYQLFSVATESQVTGLFEAGVEAPFSTLRIPRANLSPNPWRLTANQLWLSLCSERLGSATSASVVRLHMQFFTALLESVAEIYLSLINPADHSATFPLSNWEHATKSAENIPFVPRTTPSVLSVVREDGTIPHSFPGSQPIDDTFIKMRQAAINAHRELQAFVKHDKYNRAVLVHQLAELERACPSYGRLAAHLVDDIDMQVMAKLAQILRRLRKGLQVLSGGELSHEDIEAIRSGFDHFSALRALTAEVIAELAADEEAPAATPHLAQGVTTIAEAIKGMTPQIGQWTDSQALTSLVNEVADSLAREDLSPLRVAVPGWVARMQQLQSATALDLQTWLYERRRDSRLRVLVQAIESQLAQQGIRVQCKLLDEGLDEYLYVTAVVVAIVHNSEEVTNARELVATAVFDIMPEQVMDLILLTSDEAGQIMPRGFRRFRGSSTPLLHPALNPFAPWYPVDDLDDLALYAHRVGRTLTDYLHPAAPLLMPLNEAIQSFVLAFGHFSVLMTTLVEEGWEIGSLAAARVIERCTHDLATLEHYVTRVSEAVPGDNDSEAIAIQLIRRANDYLGLCILLIAGEVDADAAHFIVGNLATMREVVADLLYLGVVPEHLDTPSMDEVASSFRNFSASLASIFEQIRADFQANSLGNEVVAAKDDDVTEESVRGMGETSA
jgi:hypothetical protein